MSASFMHALSRRCAAVLASLSILASSTLALAAPTVLYLSPGGSDASDGASEKAALATLSGAVARAGSLLAAGASDVEIRVGAGRYTNQRANFEGFPAGKSLAIRGEPKAGVRPVFEGSGKGPAWLIMLAKQGDVGNLQISGVEVTGYVTAITMNGTRDAPSPAIVNVQIRDNVFRRIGQIAVPEGPPSAAALRLVNAHNVRIADNRFVEIKNLTRCTSLHAIYLAHNSTGNLIENNVFEDACGDPIRFRDRSGNNKVVRNTFINAWGKAPITDWYCDSDAREDCTKATAECPSYGNVVEGNKIQSAGKKGPQMTLTYGGDQNSACPLPGAIRGPARAITQSATRGARGPEAGQRFLVR